MLAGQRMLEFEITIKAFYPAGGLLTGDMYQYKQNLTRVSFSLGSLPKSLRPLFICIQSVIYDQLVNH